MKTFLSSQPISSIYNLNLINFLRFQLMIKSGKLINFNLGPSFARQSERIIIIQNRIILSNF